MTTLQKESPAKVNLGLRVVGKRNDGYHDIETLFTTVGLKDIVTIEKKRSGIEVTADSPDTPDGEKNLAHRAAKKTLERGDGFGGMRIALRKEIPAGAGLGGASSNAAAVIRGVDQLFDLHLEESALLQIAREVGSDVPFFMKGGAALATGRGDELSHLDPGVPLDLVIVFPGFPISTSWAYSRVDSGLTPEWFDIKILASALEHGDLSSLCKRLYNSFEYIVFKTYPELYEIKKKMMQSGALGSLLSGSGSSLFAIAPDRETASKLGDRLSGENLSVWQTTTC